jgi:hypothetical protein
MKRILTLLCLIGLVALTLSSCAYICSCEDQPAKQVVAQTPDSPLSGVQLINECKFIDEGISDSKLFSEKMSKSRYAIYYQAKSRERISSLQARAKEIGCK